MSTRRLKPRATDQIALAPLIVSDRSCGVAMGLEPRAFRSFIEACGIPHVKHGHRLLVRSSDLLEAVGRLAAATAPHDPAFDEGDDDQPTSGAEVLARIGLRRVGA